MTDDEIMTFDELYREYALKALNTSCCIRRAARRLGVTERTLYRWKRAYNIRWSSSEDRYIIQQPIKAK